MQRVAKGKLKEAAAIGMAVGKVINCWKVLSILSWRSGIDSLVSVARKIR